jgi:hypothetical protein
MQVRQFPFFVIIVFAVLAAGAYRAEAVQAGPDPTGLVLWWDADPANMTFTADPDYPGGIDTWTDTAGGYDAVSGATPCDKPTYEPDVLNGHGVVRFDGISVQDFEVGHVEELGGISGGVTDQLTVLVVGRQSPQDCDPTNTFINAAYSDGAGNYPANRYMWGLERSTDDVSQRAYAQTATGGIGDPAIYAGSGPGTGDVGFHVFGMVWGEDDSLSFFKDGEWMQSNPGADAVPFYHEYLWIGSPGGYHGYMAGDIAEILIYTDDDPALRTGAEEYLETKYNIPEPSVLLALTCGAAAMLRTRRKRATLKQRRP